MGPDGKTFNSRVKVLKHLGLTEDPLEANKPQKPARPLTAKEKQKQRVKEAVSRLNATIARSAALHEQRLQAEADAEKARCRQDEPPEPPGRLPLTDGSLAGEVMPLWSFAVGFERLLTLSSFSPDEFCEAVQRKERSTLLAELHVRLLKGLLSDFATLRVKRQVKPPMGVSLLLQQLPPPSSVTATSWPEVLRTVCWLLPEAEPEGIGAEGARESLATTEHQELSPAHKLALLRAIITAYLDLGEAGTATNRLPVHEVLKDHFDRHIALEKERRDAEATIKRDAVSQTSMIEQRKSRSISEAGMTVSSEALAASFAAQEAPPLVARGQGAKAAAAAAAAAEAAKPLPTVPFAPPPPAADVPSEEMDEGEDEAAEEAAAAAAAANGEAPPPLSPATLAKREERERRKRHEAAREALLEAMESRDVRGLERAIREAYSHEGEHTEGEHRGRPWRTEEFKAAYKMLAEAKAFEERRSVQQKEASKLNKVFENFLRNTAALPTKDESIGTDARGRHYWYFVHDPTRLYVQAPTPPSRGRPAAGASSAGPALPPWTYYDTLDLVRKVYHSLDETSLDDESKLHASLKERLPLFEMSMEADSVVNEDDGWTDEGHEYIGQHVTRLGDAGWVSDGKVTRWLPPKEAKLDELGAVIEPAEEALFHVVHEDGDEEDLDPSEADEARAKYLEHQEKGRPPELKSKSFTHKIYSNKLERRAAARITPGDLGSAGLREQLLELEDQLVVGLSKAGSAWSLSHGGRQSWLLSCRGSSSVVELAQLLTSLEATVRDLQGVPDVAERKPWRTEGHAFIGKMARRFFTGYGTSDGRSARCPPRHPNHVPVRVSRGSDSRFLPCRVSQFLDGCPLMARIRRFGTWCTETMTMRRTSMSWRPILR